ncbi:hypothetical protein WDW86_13825 [Bdellovibrionota bacterium FG-2]
MKKLILALVLLFSIASQAAPTAIKISGKKAKNMISALVALGVNYEGAAGTLYYSIERVACAKHHNTALDPSDPRFNRPTYDCNSPETDNNRKAKALVNALISAGVPSDSGMGQTWYGVNNVVCMDHHFETSIAQRYSCEMSPEIDF